MNGGTPLPPCAEEAGSVNTAPTWPNQRPGAPRCALRKGLFVTEVGTSGSIATLLRTLYQTESPSCGGVGRGRFEVVPPPS